MKRDRYWYIKRKGVAEYIRGEYFYLPNAHGTRMTSWVSGNDLDQLKYYALSNQKAYDDLNYR